MRLDRDLIPPKKKAVSKKRLLLAMLPGILVGFGLAHLIQDRWIFPITLETKAMEPAYEEGSSVYIKRDFTQEEIRPGSVVLLHHPRNKGMNLLLRVAAMEGESIALDRGAVLVNGILREPIPIPDRAARSSTEEAPIPPLFSPRDTVEPLTIPPGTLYLLADNRKEGVDSRILGPLSQDLIRGVAR